MGFPLRIVGHMFDVDGDGVPKAVYYNGYRAGEDVIGPDAVEDAGVPDGRSAKRATSRAKALGIERMAETCVQGRGVLIDLFAHFGRSCVSVSYEMLHEVMRKDGVEIEAGDIVCLHTGFAQMLLEMDREPDPRLIHHSCASLDGRDEKLLEWLTSTGIAALVADNFAVETLPAGAVDEGACFSSAPLHEHCLFKIGVHLGELWHLTPLASWLRDSSRYRFLLTAPPLRLPGAVGSPVTPVATVETPPADARAGGRIGPPAQKVPIMAFLFDHVHLLSADPAAAAEFYVNVLGATRLRSNVEGRVDLELGGQKLLISAAPTDRPMAHGSHGAFAHLAVRVSDLESAALEMRSKGTKLLRPPTEVRPGVQVAFFAAPDGIEIEVVERTETESPP